MTQLLEFFSTIQFSNPYIRTTIAFTRQSFSYLPSNQLFETPVVNLLNGIGSAVTEQGFVLTAFTTSLIEMQIQKKKIVSLFYLNEILSQSCNVLVTCSIAHSGHVFSAHFYHSILIDDLMIIFQSNLVIYGNKLIMESFTEQTSPVNSMCQTQMEKLKQKTLSVLIIKLYADSPNIN